MKPTQMLKAAELEIQRLQQAIDRQAVQLEMLVSGMAMPQTWFDARTNLHHDPVRRLGGITVRDYFAAAALSGINVHKYVPEVIARDAFAIADEMLKVRNA